jgi:hypothetical protein
MQRHKLQANLPTPLFVRVTQQALLLPVLVVA